MDFINFKACSWDVFLQSITNILTLLSSCCSQEAEFNLTKEQEEWLVGIMLSVTLVKFLLVLYCRSFTNEIVKAYAQDHFFDVITNVIGLIAALLANYVAGWMDPAGAIIVSESAHSLCHALWLSFCTNESLIVL